MSKYPITKCPKCNGKIFTVRKCIGGISEYYVDIKTGEELHGRLQYKNTKKW